LASRAMQCFIWTLGTHHFHRNMDTLYPFTFSVLSSLLY
jgi:hypothetical protein